MIQVPAQGGQTRRGVRRLLLDVVAPIATYFGLHAAGVADLEALLAGGAIAVAGAVVSVVVERRLRFLPVFVCAMFALSAGLAFAFHDARVVLLKASFSSAFFGLGLLALAARPSTLQSVLTPLVARGSDERAERWQAGWRSEPQVRRALRVASALAGVALLAEAAARAAIVLSLPVSRSIIFAHGPAIVLVVALLLIARFMVGPAVVRAMAAAPARDHA